MGAAQLLIASLHSKHFNRLKCHLHAQLNPTPLIMGLSQEELRPARVCSPLACSVRSGRNSQYLRIRTIAVMCVLSGLYSLLRNGGWKSFASVSVRKPCAALSLLLNRYFRVREQSLSSSVEVIREKVISTGWDSVPNDLSEHNVGFWKRQIESVPPETTSVGVNSKKPTTITWDSLSDNLQGKVLQNVDFRDLFRFKTSSNSWKTFVEGEAFRQARGGVSEGEFSAINNYNKYESWRCRGYDLHSKSWRSFPPLSHLPPPDPELFKEYSMCGHGGLMCAEVSKLPKKGDLVVLNSMKGKSQALPPLLHPRNPVLVHILGDSAKRSYKVIVAGSFAASDENLSRKVEVFDSSTSKWTEVSDLPGPAFELNEHQASLCLNGKLFFISFLEGGGRGVVALDVENGTWSQDLAVPSPWSSSNTLQLVESDGKLFVSSEQQRNQRVDHCIDGLEFQNPKAGVSTSRWRSFVKVRKSGGRNLQVYPEHTCVGFGEEKLPGIFSPLSKKLHKILLALFSLAIMPNGACAVDQGIQDSLSGTSTSNAWGIPDVAKKAAVTLLVVIGARVAWGIFRQRQARGNRFDIMGGLEASDMPNRGNPLHAIPANLSA